MKAHRIHANSKRNCNPAGLGRMLKIQSSKFKVQNSKFHTRGPTRDTSKGKGSSYTVWVKIVKLKDQQLVCRDARKTKVTACM